MEFYLRKNSAKSYARCTQKRNKATRKLEMNSLRSMKYGYCKHRRHQYRSKYPRNKVPIKMFNKGIGSGHCSDCREVDRERGKRRAADGKIKAKATGKFLVWSMPR
jgi:hypothetical protein